MKENTKIIYEGKEMDYLSIADDNGNDSIAGNSFLNNSASNDPDYLSAEDTPCECGDPNCPECNPNCNGATIVAKTTVIPLDDEEKDELLDTYFDKAVKDDNFTDEDLSVDAADDFLADDITDEEIADESDDEESPYYV